MSNMDYKEGRGDYYLAAGLREARKSAHECPLPALSSGSTAPQRPPWRCSTCGRVWLEEVTSSGLRWWTEVQGPDNPDPDEAERMRRNQYLAKTMPRVRCIVLDVTTDEETG